MTAPSRLPGIVALVLATGSWGLMFFIGKDVLRDIDPVWLTLSRYSIAAAVFAVLLAPRGRAPWQRLRRDALPLGVLGLLGFGVFGVLVMAGLKLSVPTHGAVIMATVPITAQLVRWGVDGVRPGWVTSATALLALAGVAIVSGVLLGHAETPAGSAVALGDGLALLGTLGWVFYTRGPARFPALDVLEYTALTMLAAWPPMALAALAAAVFGLAPLPPAGAVAAHAPALLYIGVVASTVAMLGFNFGVRTLGAVTSTAFMNLVPVSALLIGVALGRLPQAHELLGMAMVVAALLIHTFHRRAAAAPVAVP